MNDKIRKAIEIFKAQLPEAKGKFRPMVSAVNGNVVEFFTDGILYASINIRSGMVKI